MGENKIPKEKKLKRNPYLSTTTVNFAIAFDKDTCQLNTNKITTFLNKQEKTHLKKKRNWNRKNRNKQKSTFLGSLFKLPAFYKKGKKNEIKKNRNNCDHMETRKSKYRSVML